MKTIVFTMFLRGWDIRKQQIFESKIIRNRACNPNMLFDTSNHAKYEKVNQKWVPKTIQNPSKIDINPPWDIQDISRPLLSEPWHQMITKLMPKWSPRTPKYSKNGFPRPLKSINFNAACQQLPGGRRQGRSLKLKREAWSYYKR